jgi:sec-independent protein translocase protein TatA
MTNILSTIAPPPHLLALGLPTGWEWIVLLVLGLLIFGRRLPEVGRSIGRSIVEFKKGIKGIEEEIESETNASAASKASRQELPNTAGSRVANSRETQKEPISAGDE